MGNAHSGFIGEVTGGRKRYHRKKDRAVAAACQEAGSARQTVVIAKNELANQKLMMLQQLNLEVNKAKDNVEKWYNNSLQEAKHIQTSKEIELQVITQQLHDEQKKYLQKINAQYEREITKLNIEKQDVSKQIKDKLTIIIDSLEQITSENHAETKSVFNLHQSIYDAVHSGCNDLNIIYAKLINPLTAKEQKYNGPQKLDH